MEATLKTRIVSSLDKFIEREDLLLSSSTFVVSLNETERNEKGTDT